jgi:hypothetical protein
MILHSPPGSRRQRLGDWSAPVSRNATVIADEHASYNDLAGLNKLKRVDHSKVY